MDVDVAVPVPPRPFPHSKHCHVQPSLPSQPEIGSVRAGIVSQVRMGSKTEGTTQQNVPNPDDRRYAAPIPDLALGTPVSPGPEQVVKNNFYYYFD